MNATGVKASPVTLRSYDYDTLRPCGSDNITLPDTYILPEEYIPPVRNQFEVGACVSFAMCGCAESHALKNGETVTYGKGWNYGRDECRAGVTEPGLIPEAALKGILKIGFVPMMYFPFLKEVPEASDLANSRDDLLEMGKANKPSAYASMNYAMEDKKWDSIKRALAIDNSALVIISHNYFSESHAVMGIGYTNKKGKKTGRYVTFQNSWGSTWSTDGRDEIPLHYIDAVYVILWDKIKFPFVDVKESDWFFDDVRSVYLSGLVSGTTETTYEPNASFKRGDFAIILSRTIDKFEYSMNAFIKSLEQQGKNATNISFKKWTKSTIPFKDVKKTDYYAEAICHAYANGLINGISKKEFAPEATVTRAEAAAICVRLIEMLQDMLKNAIDGIDFVYPSIDFEDFTDVVKGSWYENYVESACSLGIMQGNGDGTFAPEKGIIRCEGAAILHRLFKFVEDLMMQAAK